MSRFGRALSDVQTERKEGLSVEDKAIIAINIGGGFGYSNSTGQNYCEDKQTNSL